jgi:hypothetical protein
VTIPDVPFKSIDLRLLRRYPPLGPLAHYVPGRG